MISPTTHRSLYLTLHVQLRVVAFHSLKRPTSIGKLILLAAKVLDHSLSSAIQRNYFLKTVVCVGTILNRVSLLQFVFVQPLFHISCISTFSLITPPLTLHDRLRVLAFRYLKRPTGIGGRIRLTAEVLDHSFTSAVTDRGHVERTTLFLTYLLTLGI